MAIQFDQNYDDGTNDTIRNSLEKEYFDLKIMGIYLIDVVPYEKKEMMINGLRSLFTGAVFMEYDLEERFKLIPDMKIKGQRSWVRIGAIYSGKQIMRRQSISNLNSSNEIPLRRYLELPKPCEQIEIYVMQYLPQFYYILYCCSIDSAYHEGNIRNNFIHSLDMVPSIQKHFDEEIGFSWEVRGPKNDMTMNQYENEISAFLANYSHGILLGNYATRELFCPSIRILSTKYKNNNIEDLVKSHPTFLQFIGLRYLFSILNGKLLAYQEDSIHTATTYPKGIGLVYFENFWKETDYSILMNKIMDDSRHISLEIVPILLPFYWLIYQNYDVIRKWMEAVQMLPDLPSHRQKQIDMKKIKSKLESIIELYTNFALYANEELSVNRQIHESTKYTPLRINLLKPKDQNFEFNIIEDMKIGIKRELEYAQNNIQDIHNRISTLLNYYKDLISLELNFSNTKLQNQLKILTVVIGIAAALVPILIELLR